MLNWKEEVQNYYRNNPGNESFGGGVRIGLPPTEYDNVHTAQTEKSKPVIIITSPSSNSSIEAGGFQVSLDINAQNNIEKVEYYINDKLEYFTSTAPYTGHLNVSKFTPKGSQLLIVAKVTDKLGYSSQSAIQIKVAQDGESSIIKEEPKPEEPPLEITPPLINPDPIPESTPVDTITTDTPIIPDPPIIDPGSDSIFNT